MEHKGTVGICSNHHLAHSESIEQLALNEVCVTVHLLLTAARRTPAVRASRRTVRASWLVSQYKGVAWTILGSVLTVDPGFVSSNTLAALYQVYVFCSTTCLQDK